MQGHKPTTQAYVKVTGEKAAELQAYLKTDILPVKSQLRVLDGVTFFVIDFNSLPTEQRSALVQRTAAATGESVEATYRMCAEGGLIMPAEQCVYWPERRPAVETRSFLDRSQPKEWLQ